MKQHFDLMTHTAPETIRGFGYRKANFFEQSNLPQMAAHYANGNEHPVSEKVYTC